MRKTIVLLALCLFVSTVALAHEGHKHKLLGTVKTLKDAKLELTLKDGEMKTVTLTEKTEITKGEHKADKAALVEGARVAVEVDEDDVALTIKVAESEHKH
jgi:hypothetical protein